MQVRPMATVETVGAFINELRVVVIDGTCLDIPDSDENARVFGRPGSRPGTISAFPKARLVILLEAGTHLIFDALINTSDSFWNETRSFTGQGS